MRRDFVLFLPRSRLATFYGVHPRPKRRFREASCLRFDKHANSLTHLPPPFPGSGTMCDAIGWLADGESGPREFGRDRFNFDIHPELYEQRLTGHNTFIGRFAAPGVGECWTTTVAGTTMSPSSGPLPNKSFTAPRTMKPTPATFRSRSGFFLFPKTSPVLPSPSSLPLPSRHLPPR